jgi:hypothetical protein
MKPLVASIALLLCLTSATFCASDTEVTSAEAQVMLVAPRSARIGELVRLDVSESTADVVRIIGPPPMPSDDSLAAWIPFWNWSAGLPQAECEQLAASFEAVAAQKDRLTTPEEWIVATAEANRKVLGDRLDAWTPMLDKIGANLMKRAESGALSTSEDHAKVWLEIAQGLRNC